MPLASTYTRLHVHTCTIQAGVVSTTADAYHPGTGNLTVSFTSPTEHTAIKGRLQRLDSIVQAEAERAGGGVAGTIVATHFWWMKRADAPSTLIDWDSTPAPEVRHRIVNVARSGTVFDAGPFDVQRVLDLAGSNDVIKLELKRIT